MKSSAGGIYSGAGVTNGGNGMTYAFNPATAGVGTHSMTYSFTNTAGCFGNASDNVVVFALPTVSISLSDTLFVMNGMPPLNVPGGGMPVGGVYSDAFGETSDDGNGLTFSFKANFVVGDNNVIIYHWNGLSVETGA